MKILKKFMAVCFTVLLFISTVGCGSTADDPNTLYVGFFNGGLGDVYISEIIKEYRALNSDIKIEIVPGKSEYDDSMLSASIKTKNASDIYFLDANTYMNFVNSNSFADITDVVSEKIYDNDMNLVLANGTKSILDSVWDDWKDICRVSINGADKYYAVPNYAAPSGIFYDEDLFNAERYSVPETYPQFIALMNRMKAKYTPFAFSNFDYVVVNGVVAFYAEYEGAENFFLNSTFSGTDSVLGEITLQNANKLQTQLGRKAAIQFIHDLVRKEYISQSTRNGMDNVNAQEEFITSINFDQEGRDEKRIAMFIEQSYWEREAKSTFDEMSVFDENLGFGKRNIKFMKTPKIVGVDGISDQSNTKDTVYTTGSNSFIAINANSTKIDMAKDFLKFVQSRRALALHTIYSGTLRPYDYKLTTEEIELCTPMVKSIYDLTQDTNVEFTTLAKLNSISRAQNTDFNYDWLMYTRAETDDGLGARVIKSGRNGLSMFMSNKKLTVNEYFEGMANYWTDVKWQSYNR